MLVKAMKTNKSKLLQTVRNYFEGRLKEAPTTGGTILTTAWSITSALLESFAATATDNAWERRLLTMSYWRTLCILIMFILVLPSNYGGEQIS